MLKKHLLPVVAFLCVFLLQLKTANAECHKTALENLFRQKVESEKLTENIDFIYFPKAGFYAISHIELNVKDNLWHTLFNTTKGSPYAVAERNAKIGGKSFYRFRLKVSPDELNRLQNYLDEGAKTSRLQTCVSGACRALNRSGILYIPPPFSKIPLLSAVYLRLMKLSRARRIESVHFVGKSQLKSLFTAEVAVESFYALQSVCLGVFVVESIDEAGRKFIDWIRVDEKPSP